MKSILSFVALTALLASSGPAFAQDDACSSDADCPAGTTCQEVAYACPGCAGADCPPCDPGPTHQCEPAPPASCDENNPCEDGLVCVTYTFEECTAGTGVACPDNQPCEVDAGTSTEPDCTTQDDSYCVPKWLAPCTVDSDCGSGFTCVEGQACTCEGGGGVRPLPAGDSADAGTAPTTDAGGCTCEPSGDKYCELDGDSCSSDTDCDDGFVCILQSAPVSGTCTTTPDGGTDCQTYDAGTGTAEGQCAPEGYEVWGGAYAGGTENGGAGYGDVVAQATGHDDANVKSSERNEFFPVDGNGNGDGTKATPRACSVVSMDGAAGNGLPALLMLLGLVFLRRRRS